MSTPLHALLDRQVDVAISGNHRLTGRFADAGLDLIILQQEQRFYYIPLIHIQSLQEARTSTAESVYAMPEPFLGTDGFSFRKLLNHAKGRFVEIFIAGNKSFHGYFTSIMNDYFVFYSPVYKAMYVSMNHLKWLIPYPSESAPYTLPPSSLLSGSIPVPLSRTFAEQCKKLEGSLVILDLGEHCEKTGLIGSVDQQMAELIQADGKVVLWNLHHLKTITLV